MLEAQDTPQDEVHQHQQDLSSSENELRKSTARLDLRQDSQSAAQPPEQVIEPENNIIL